MPISARQGVSRPIQAPVPHTGELTQTERIIPLFRHHFRERPFKYFRKLFTRFDTDGNGTISADELAKGLSDIYPGMTREQVDGMFAAIQAYDASEPYRRRVPGGKRVERRDTAGRANWWPSYIQAEKEAQKKGASRRPSQVSGKASPPSAVWPPVQASARGESSMSTRSRASSRRANGEAEVSFHQFFEFLMNRKEHGDVFDPWTVDYNRCASAARNPTHRVVPTNT